LHRAQQKLKDEERRTLEKQIQISSQLLRLQKQKKFLQKRASCFLQFDAASVKELKHLKEKKARKTVAAQQKQKQTL
jgi:hypothetical protein